MLQLLALSAVFTIGQTGQMSRGPRQNGAHEPTGYSIFFAWVYSHHTRNCDFLAKLTINNRKFSSPTTLSIQYTVLPYSPNVHLLLIDELDSEINDFFLVSFGEISSFLIFEEKDSIFLNHFEDSFNEIQSSETIGEVYSGILSRSECNFDRIRSS